MTEISTEELIEKARIDVVWASDEVAENHIDELGRRLRIAVECLEEIKNIRGADWFSRDKAAKALKQIRSGDGF